MISLDATRDNFFSVSSFISLQLSMMFTTYAIAAAAFSDMNFCPSKLSLERKRMEMKSETDKKVNIAIGSH